ncbi:hypothetical protein MKY96_32530 [Paenibacillus sp. FSL R7-0302]|uniref:hypothetical protein n=1 Tax=Paenibacillus sp. FSL R7-0302 TaxID=2921681 RepID=UPI0030F913EA
MSEKGGKILYDLWGRVDQADYDMMIKEAFASIPTQLQKKFIESILDSDNWDLNGEPTEEEKKQFRKYVLK